jgi:hypothetical protein
MLLIQNNYGIFLIKLRREKKESKRRNYYAMIKIYRPKKNAFCFKERKKKEVKIFLLQLTFMLFIVIFLIIRFFFNIEKSPNTIDRWKIKKTKKKCLVFQWSDKFHYVVSFRIWKTMEMDNILD